MRTICNLSINLFDRDESNQATSQIIMMFSYIYRLTGNELEQTSTQHLNTRSSAQQASKSSQGAFYVHIGGG
jgi:hypothetical protein